MKPLWIPVPVQPTINLYNIINCWENLKVVEIDDQKLI